MRERARDGVEIGATEAVRELGEKISERNFHAEIDVSGDFRQFGVADRQMLDRRSRCDDAPKQRRRVSVALFIVATDQEELWLLKSPDHVAKCDKIRHIRDPEVASRSAPQQ